MFTFSPFGNKFCRFGLNVGGELWPPRPDDAALWILTSTWILDTSVPSYTET